MVNFIMKCLSEIEHNKRQYQLHIEKSQSFGRHYEQIYNKCRFLINDNENDYEITKSKSNICFSLV